jgi:hypothetical protein
VTLAEGHSIDVTTGLYGAAQNSERTPMALKSYNPTTPASASWSRRPFGLWKGKPVKS